MGEPVDGVPQTGANQGECDKVEAGGSEEEAEKDELEGSKGHICRDQEGWGGAWSEDAGPQLFHEGSHGCCGGDYYRRGPGKGRCKK